MVQELGGHGSFCERMSVFLMYIDLVTGTQPLIALCAYLIIYQNSHGNWQCMSHPNRYSSYDYPPWPLNNFLHLVPTNSQPPKKFIHRYAMHTHTLQTLCQTICEALSVCVCVCSNCYLIWLALFTQEHFSCKWRSLCIAFCILFTRQWNEHYSTGWNKVSTFRWLDLLFSQNGCNQQTQTIMAFWWNLCHI